MTPELAEEWTQGAAQVLSGQFRQIDTAIKLGVPEALGMTSQQWVNERLGGYVRLALEDRKAVHQALASEGLSQRQIAERTGVDQKTVSNDLKYEENSSPDSESTQVAKARTISTEENSSPDDDVCVVNEIVSQVRALAAPSYTKTITVRDRTHIHKELMRIAKRLEREGIEA